MDNEIKVVTRQETFNDLAVRELAKSRAACICRLQFKRCKSSRCASCPKFNNFSDCFNVMNSYDKERLSTYISEYYSVYSYNPAQWMSHKEYKKYFFGVICLILLCVTLFLAPILFVCNDFIAFDTPPEAGINFNEVIPKVVRETQRTIYDLNSDGKINCTDYAVHFKRTWDRQYPKLKWDCALVRNMNSNVGMKHLFVIIQDYEGNTWEVEPSAPDPDRFLMKENWATNFYNPKYNRYTESMWWENEWSNGD